MGIVQEQKRQIENLKKKTEGLERKTQKMKEISNDRARRLAEANMMLDTAEATIRILVEKLGGEAEIKEDEWKKDRRMIICHYNREKESRVLKLV